MFQLTAGHRLRPFYAPVPWRCTSFQDLLGRADGPRWSSPAALGVNLLLLQQVHSFSETSGQSVPANPARSPGAGSQYTRRVSLTLCRKLKRSRSGGTAAMVQVTSQPAPLPPGFDPPIVALLWLPPANRSQGAGKKAETSEPQLVQSPRKRRTRTTTNYRSTGLRL